MHQGQQIGRLRATMKGGTGVLSRTIGTKTWGTTRDGGKADESERQKVYGKSMWLQMLLYYNMWYSICFTGIAWVAYIWKSNKYDVAWKHQVWYGVVMGLWTLFELARLLCGYIGNRTSSVQHLIGFFVFSVMNLALVIVFYMVDKGLPRQSHDRALSIVHLLFIIPELFAAFLEAQRQIKYHTVRFYLSLGTDTVGL